MRHFYSWSDYKYNTILQIYIQITFTYLQDCRSIQDFWKQISMSEKKSCFEYLFCYTRLNINTFYKNTDIYILQIYTRLNINTLFNNTDIYIFQIYSRLHIYIYIIQDNTYIQYWKYIQDYKCIQGSKCI